MLECKMYQKHTHNQIISIEFRFDKTTLVLHSFYCSLFTIVQVLWLDENKNSTNKILFTISSFAFLSSRNTFLVSIPTQVRYFFVWIIVKLLDFVYFIIFLKKQVKLMSKAILTVTSCSEVTVKMRWKWLIECFKFV